MVFFNIAQIAALLTGQYICSECGESMEFEDENEDVLICPKCGNSEDLDYYGFKNDQEYESLYPTKEEVCGYGDDDEDEVYNELSDD